MGNTSSPDWENLTTEQYYDIATGHDISAWQAQQEAFAALRDLCDEVAEECRAELDKLRETWSGRSVRAFEAHFEKLLSTIDFLRDSAASNSDGMREMAAEMRELSSEARLLRSEDREWQRNPEGDDDDTVRRLRDNLRGELRDKIVASDEQFQRLATSYLLPPPQVPDNAGLPAEPKQPGPVSPAPQAIEQPRDTESGAGPRLQSTAAPPPVEPVPTQQAPPPAVDAPTPMMPMGAEGAAGTAGGSSGGAAGRSGGPKFEETKQEPRSRMRSRASRQELLNQERYGDYQRPDAQRHRRVDGAGEDSPFASDAKVVPPVVSGGTPPVGPHDSGPVMTGTVYRYFPEYGLQESPEQFEETFDDGARAEVHVPKADKAEDSLSRLTSGNEAPKDQEASAVPQQPKGEEAFQRSPEVSGKESGPLPGDQVTVTTQRDHPKPDETPAPRTDDDGRVRRATDSRESLSDQRRRRREARRERRQSTRGDEDE